VSARPQGTRRGIFLLDLLIALTLLVPVVFFLTRTMVDLIYLENVVAKHENRRIVIADFLSRFRAELLAATHARFDASGELPVLRLRAHGESGEVDIEHVFSPERVVRRENGVEVRVWEAERLNFAVREESVGARSVYVLEFTELPPARMDRRTPRTWVVHVLAPPAPEDSR